MVQQSTLIAKLAEGIAAVEVDLIQEMPVTVFAIWERLSK